MSEPAILVEKLCKSYRIGHAVRKPATFREAMKNAATSPFRYLKYQMTKATEEDTIWALRDISFEVQEGEVLGIIGRNGAGKSTLLKILSRITDPTSGRAVVRGHVNSLLEVGTGFHPELTGRENVFMSAALHGLRRADIKRKLEEIIDFSGIDKFVDTPVKRYSSGMYTRLAFAVAAHLEPDVMIVDEVLAVGDAEFQKKCLGKMNDVANAGRTVLFVSHQMPMINKLCARCILLEGGQVRCIDETSKVVEQYLMKPDSGHHGFVQFEDRDDQPIFLREVSVLNAEGKPSSVVRYQEKPHLRFKIFIRQRNPKYYAVLHILNARAEPVIFTADDDLAASPLADAAPGEFVYDVRLPEKLLKPGNYTVTIKLCELMFSERSKVFDEHEQALTFTIEDVDSHRAKRNAYREFATVAPEIQWTKMS